MTTFLTSDSHFGHQGIIGWLDRPFASVEAINDGIVAIWNAVVRPKDTVWHLGDFSLGPRGTAAKHFRRLNGIKHLVIGNHDGDDVRSCGWASVQDMASWKHDGVRLTLCHYPLPPDQRKRHLSSRLQIGKASGFKSDFPSDIVGVRIRNRRRQGPVRPEGRVTDLGE